MTVYGYVFTPEDIAQKDQEQEKDVNTGDNKDDKKEQPKSRRNKKDDDK